jgi:hypothetical protein
MPLEWWQIVGAVIMIIIVFIIAIYFNRIFNRIKILRGKPK